MSDLAADLEHWADTMGEVHRKGFTMKFLDGTLFSDSAKEIRYLRNVITMTCDMLETQFPKTAQQICLEAMYLGPHSWRESDDRTE